MDYYGTARSETQVHTPSQWFTGRFASFLCGCILAAGVTVSVQRSSAQVGEFNYAVGARTNVRTAPVGALSVRSRVQPLQAPAALNPSAASRRTTTLHHHMVGAGWAPSAKMPRKFIVGGNWKCNGDRASIKALVDALNSGASLEGSGVDVVVAPPMLYGDYTRGMLRPDFSVAFQNCWVGAGGAFTGEVSADMIKDAGFDWVILGHSERRLLPELKESDEVVATKTAYALEAGLKVILCIGETLDKRQSGQTDEVNARQLSAVKEQVKDWSNIVIAYEPVWAIGTGVVATPEQAQETHQHIRQWLADNVSPEVAAKMQIMYGGSANAANAASLAVQPDVDGFLVGGASLKPEFLQVVYSWKAKLEH